MCEDFVWGGLSRPLFLSSGRNFFDKSLEALGYMRLGAIQQLHGQDEGGEGQKMAVFVHTQGIKTVQADAGGVKKCQNSIHVVVE